MVALASAERFDADALEARKVRQHLVSRGICCRLHREGLAAARARSQAAQAPGVGRTRYRCPRAVGHRQLVGQQIAQGRRGRRRTGVLVVHHHITRRIRLQTRRGRQGNTQLGDAR